ncbi:MULTISPECIES: 3-hydroxyacyl-CoA dehydrogenase/enoyl-CoA hydratase family protein [Deefgea]|uniref:3-hydroxyacyl-CoA dehydrogenase n=1 Tax=Deefgea chitinilytica TaxID=570276 RepID=A0ABS2C8T4_9NEIS|nr:MULTISPECIES: 3-hydroxyacyl-CoA dehydrogenase/enoyl-CoA hydratase family protein [Deefgea]MBM5570462.1 3-hydroxyacyl-CoA dehydrogenase [Deefgea chitinilytica]MBM9887691.1 3-hydroxyacyl-CoA dehydrogenase/enoyl-CoA hydratase family protein [Deefgea sp. CFH1-16]
MTFSATSPIRRVAVLGAGVMGAQIAAHLSNAGIDTILFDLPAAEGDPNAITLKALDNLKKLKPAPLMSAGRVDGITPANYGSDLGLLADCDLVIEAIAERLDWKADLYSKIAPHLAPHAILASNTSGLSIEKLAASVPAQMQSRFCGIHFFNPPRYMYLVELIATKACQGDTLDVLETFLTLRLGKGVVRAKDTPNFIANRIGVFSMLATIRHAETFGIRFDVVDDLTGPKLGRPKSATFRTADVVGLDTFAHVVKTMTDTLYDDPWHSLFQMPEWLNRLIAAGALGQKTRQGIFKKVGKDVLMLDPVSGEYIAGGQKASDEVKALLKNPNAAAKIAALRASENPEAQFIWACLRDVWHYIAVQLAHIADNARDVDFAIRWGFGWEQGPFEMWQAAGWQAITTAINEDIAAGKTLSNTPLPAWVMARDGVHTPQGSFSAATAQLVGRSNLPVYERQFYPPTVLGEAEPDFGETLFENDSVRMWLPPASVGTAANDVPVLSFKTKAHCIGANVLAGVQEAIKIAEQYHPGLVIWHSTAPFSVGADLMSMGPAFMTGDFAAIENMVAEFQNTSQAIKYAKVPVVGAAQGYAFGGGCEFLMHCARVVAHVETYIGLVEVGVGLLPAGGGCKEFALRASRLARNGNILEVLKDYYLAMATAKVGTSAEEGQQIGYLKESDVIVMNANELLYVAQAQVRAMAASGYRAPVRPKAFAVAGRSGAATIRAQLVNMLEGGFISKYDFHIGVQIAEIVCGGDVDAGTLVNEDWILKLERERFMGLLKKGKTQERIMHMIEFNKPLRN